MEDLAAESCLPCSSFKSPMSVEEAESLLGRVKGWKVSGNRLEKEFKFRDFRQAMTFANRVADLAESQNHHPDILVFSWNRVRLTLYTHVVGGLTRNDFVLAAKIDKLAE